ncbi:tetratricopeptide repeat protein [Pararhizobium gei]|uniref:tetratricopeptide repeat protein n=1 Tax=Pararhizobium gei TaxID=1395951 RepID=UPI0023D98B09|nr:hypothetical protein [Rhizobium gei]
MTVIEAGNFRDAPRCLVIAFSSFGDNDPSSAGFGQAFLEKNGCSVIAVKKRADNWYRDLSPEQLAEIVMPLRSEFNACFTYGASMGGYAALYFASAIGAQPIAISPRNSVDPRFMLPEFARFVSMSQQQHQILSSVADPAVRPRVVFDPNVKSDLAYIDMEVRPAFPEGFYTAFPFSGHPSAEAMSDTGQLKSYVLAALEGQPAPPRLWSRASKRHSVVILNEMSKWNLARQRIERAMRLSELALTVGGDRTDLLYHQGSVLIAAGKLEEALELTRKTIDGRGGSASLFHRIASLSVRLDRLESAVDAADAGLQISPGSIGLLRTRRNALEKIRRFDDALRDGLALVETQAANMSDRLHLASILMAKQAYADALLHLDIVLEQDRNLLAMRRRRDCLEALRRLSEARVAAAEVVDNPQAGTSDILQLAHLHATGGDLPKAIETLNLAVLSAPDNPAVHRRRRIYLAQAGRIAEALQSALVLSEIAPGNEHDAAAFKQLQSRQRWFHLKAKRRELMLFFKRMLSGYRAPS